MDFDLMKYRDVVQTVCLKSLTRRQCNDILRQIHVYPERIHICPCVSDSEPWLRETLRFLGAILNNEPSHQ
jgi:hypothetical protein